MSSVEIVLPDLTESATSVKIASWLKREGESVVAGQPIVEVETDKTTVEIEAPASGVLTTICVPAGTDGVSVGTVLGVVVEGDIKSHAESSAEGPSAPESFSGTREQGSGEPVDGPLIAATDRLSATLLASRMAMLAGIDLAELSASQGGARLRKADVDRLLRTVSGSTPQAATRLKSPTPPPPSPPDAPLSADSPLSMDPGGYDAMTLTPMRRVTAARLQQAKQQIPHFYLQVDCNVSALVRLRARLNAHRAPGLTVTDFLVVACALALRDVPLANAVWTDEAVRIYRAVDIALAVNTAKGLVTPVVRNCLSKELDEISVEVKRLTERARAGHLSPNEYNGGTFTISNLGMFGISAATPILNPPQCCILGVGAIERRPVAVGDGLAVGDVMSCTLAADHRAIDGATGAELLHAIRRRLEDPDSLIRQP